MKSKVYVTFEMDDSVAACNDLCGQLNAAHERLKNSVGLIFCYSDMESDSLVKELYNRTGIPMIGGTGVASMDHIEGFHEMSVVLIVMTADDCDFSIAVSEPITTSNIVDQIGKTYNTATSGTEGAPELVYVIPPYKLDIMLDSYTEAFTAIAPQVPFIGGLPSCNGNGDENLTIFNGETYPDRLVMLAISGNIRPVFSVQTVLENNQIQKRKVTKAKNNVIYEVDNKVFTEYLIDVGIPLDSIAEGNKSVTFVSNPLLIEDTRDGFGDSFRYLRSLHDVNMQDGSGIAIGQIPEGSYISVHPLNRSEIGEAALKGIRNLNEQMQEQSADGYEFSTVLAISCIGRYVIMTPNGEVETSNILQELPENMSLAGFYSYGEISPLPTPKGLVSFSHNESLVLCAF
ncbi:MAG: FIST N-terminal domain-containing protein [Lachnospiraceae bacterium]